MKKRIIATTCLSALFFSQVSFSGNWGQPPLFKETELKLDVSGINQFDIDVGAGDIRIEGREDIQEILVEAKIYGKRIEEEDFILLLNKQGHKATLEAFFNSDKNHNEKINLVVSMPSSLALNLNDRSGDIWINSVNADVRIEDRSGDIELSEIGGNLDIEDRSGDLTGSQIKGDVSVADRSGDIHLKDLGGDLTVDDSSGDVYVRNTTGKVTVDDSSGDIRINGAASFKLKGDSSGDVVLRNVEYRK